MKNCNVILALLFGYMIAGVSNYGPDDLAYVDRTKIESAPAIDFLWTQWFGIGFYGPAVIPLLIAYIVTTVETIGDVTATHEVSELRTDDKEYNHRLQGSLLADAVCSILASVFTSMPNTTFSQNNGVIAMTRCASRRAGLATGEWGDFAKGCAQLVVLLLRLSSVGTLRLAGDGHATVVVGQMETMNSNLSSQHQLECRRCIIVRVVVELL